MSLENTINEAIKTAMREKDKVALDRQKTLLDMVNKERDRQVKMHDIDTKYKIAKENKNRYDFKGKSKSKK